MILKLRKGELEKLIPAVATGKQFNAASGDPRKILQRLMVSSIGGVITLLISQSQVTSQFYPFWLLLGVSCLLYILWGPILEASRKNAEVRRLPVSALFEGEVINIFTKEKIENRHEQANKKGELELVENRRTWIFLEIGDEDGYLTEIKFPLESKHQLIRTGSLVRLIIFSNNSRFESIIKTSDAWFPREKLWAGSYPYLLRPAFEELCYYRFR
ncbi:hypothetical protein [Prochlorococcus marinus]|uniref:Uncharacterized protein n=1 Tax=Prochlorococcus marinus (strain MIT 9211) TaxID=93059 RepID=A9BAK3_PROM4|nr:hypothetical protein [Prochlorococcus marinus]ABX08865.1 conserved hypothetical protein [Prochlorococcus marinus str. MIT 9211]